MCPISGAIDEIVSKYAELYIGQMNAPCWLGIGNFSEQFMFGNTEEI